MLLTITNIYDGKNNMFTIINLIQSVRINESGERKHTKMQPDMCLIKLIKPALNKKQQRLKGFCDLFIYFSSFMHHIIWVFQRYFLVAFKSCIFVSVLSKSIWREEFLFLISAEVDSALWQKKPSSIQRLGF